MDEFNRLLDTIRRLRAPDGCPWDRAQTHDSLKPYLLEETYEALDALDKKDLALFQEELGDLLLQIVLHSVIAEEKNTFTFADVARGVADKMIRRHPHVFADTQVSGQDEIWQNWEQIKKTEKSHQAAQSILDSVPRDLPALFRAEKVQKKAARVGFDLDLTSQAQNSGADLKPFLEKVREEIDEFAEAAADVERSILRIRCRNVRNKIIDEFGDILFSLVNLARRLDLDAESALRQSTGKFETRFRKVEEKLRQRQKDFKDCSVEELDKYWKEAKLSG